MRRREGEQPSRTLSGGWGKTRKGEERKRETERKKERKREKQGGQNERENVDDTRHGGRTEERENNNSYHTVFKHL